MRLPVAAAVNTTACPDLHLHPLRVAAVAWLLASAVICAVFLARAVPRPCLEAIGAPADGLARLGGLQLRWIPPAGYNVRWLAHRLEQRGIVATLHEQPGTVIIDVPGVRDGDLSWTALTGDGRVEVHALRDNGTIGDEVLFDEANVAEAVVTSQLASVPVVAMLFHNTPGRTRAELDARFAGHRLAVTVDHVIRWTPMFHSALEGGLMWFTLDQHDVDALAAALYGEVLPGGRLLRRTYVPPTDITQLVWRARAAMAIGGGFVFAALVGLFLGAAAAVLRDRAPRLIRTTKLAGAARWHRGPRVRAR
jgi:hypothetical protein